MIISTFVTGWTTMSEGSSHNSVSAVVFLIVSIVFLFVVHVNGWLFQVLMHLKQKLIGLRHWIYLNKLKRINELEFGNHFVLKFKGEYAINQTHHVLCVFSFVVLGSWGSILRIFVCTYSTNINDSITGLVIYKS